MKILLDYAKNIAVGYPRPEDHNEPPISRKMLRRDGVVVSIHLSVRNTTKPMYYGNVQTTIMEVYEEGCSEPITKAECGKYEIMVYDLEKSVIETVMFVNYFGVIRFALGLEESNRFNIAPSANDKASVPGHIETFRQYNSILFRSRELPYAPITLNEWIKLPEDDYWAVYKDLEFMDKGGLFSEYVSREALQNLITRFKVNKTFEKES